MEPIFFPFTTISDVDFQAMGTWFRRFIIYRPSGLNLPAAMQTMAQQGRLDIREPVQGDDKKLENVLKAYRAWADLHQRDGLSHFKAFGETVPFFDDTTPSKIRNDIWKTLDRDRSGGESGDLFNARLFLQIAQDLDSQNAEVQKHLDRLDLKQRALFEELQGEVEAELPRGQPDGLSAGPEDPGAYMTAERMAAWSRLMLSDPASSGIFITTSRAVFEFISDTVPEAQNIQSIDFVSVSSIGSRDEKRRQPFASVALEKLACEAWTGKWPDMGTEDQKAGGDAKPSLSIRIIPGKTPVDFFSRFIGRNREAVSNPQVPGKIQNTLIGVVSP